MYPRSKEKSGKGARLSLSTPTATAVNLEPEVEVTLPSWIKSAALLSSRTFTSADVALRESLAAAMRHVKEAQKTSDRHSSIVRKSKALILWHLLTSHPIMVVPRAANKPPVDRLIKILW